jgi:16S rRNA pseudouridine516 synthase
LTEKRKIHPKGVQPKNQESKRARAKSDNRKATQTEQHKPSNTNRATQTEQTTESPFEPRPGEGRGSYRGLLMAPGEASVRLDKILANLGYGSRADVKKWIAWGEAAVAGDDGSILVVRDPGAKVKPSAVRFRREPLQRFEGICVLLNKPVGYVCSHDEDEGPRIYDLLPEQWSRRNPQIVSIGRLDKDSSGLIVVTDNHPIVHRLTSPKHHVEKTYVVTLDREPEIGIVEVFAEGTLLLDKEDKPCLPAKLSLRGNNDDGTYTCEVVMTEGRFRQVRRMFGTCGRTVITLQRTHFGQWSLNDLPEGHWMDASPIA